MRTTHHHNGLKTLGLFAVLWVILLAIGGAISVGTRNSMWILVFGAIGLVQTAFSYWFSAKFALASMKAYPVTEQEAPLLYKIVRELSQKAGKPMPSIHISPTASPNAFATGRNPENAAVCCTEGILDILDERELRGVLGHELMHVYNRDILTQSIAVAIGGLITTVAQFLQFSFMFGGRDDEDRSPLNAVVIIAMAILAPFAAMFVRMAISRTREFDADEDGARLCGDPLALASALRKLESGTQFKPLIKTPRTEQVSAMMIANPFGKISQLFSTHPPMDQRIARLEQMAREMGQGGGPVIRY